MEGKDKKITKEQIDSMIGQRRTYHQRIQPYMLQNKFSSKHDFYVYLKDQLVSALNLQKYNIH